MAIGARCEELEARASVKDSHAAFAIAGARDHEKVMHNCCPSHIKQVLALAPVARLIALPVADVGQAVLRRHAFPQSGPSFGRQLPFAQLLPQLLIGMKSHRPTGFARGAALPQRRGPAD